MYRKQNIGEWSAYVEKGDDQSEIIIMGTFPTNGEKPGYRLIKNDPQGIIADELLLTLKFGHLATPEGSVDFSVRFKEPITTVGKYNTVLVIDEDVRTIANINVLQKFHKDN